MFNDVTFNKGKFGLGIPLTGTDYVSALLFYSDATLPTGFSSGSRIKTVYSVDDAVNLGITNTSLGETRATSTYTVTTKFTAGDTFKYTVATIASTSPVQADALAGVITLANFTAQTADAVSITTSAAAIAAAINAGTITHGFTASPSVGVVTITWPAGQGIFPNTGTPFVQTVTGAIVGSIVQNVVAGVSSDIDILYYHVSEFFRLQPKGKLYIGFYATADVGTFASIALMQNFGVGEINQMGIYQKSAVFATSQLNAIQSQITALEALHKPLVCILGGEISGTADVTTISTNLHTLNDPQVSLTIGQDGAAQGFKLYKATGKSITNVGEFLGAIAFANVNESVSWLDKFQVSTSELDTVAFANGQLFGSVSDGAAVNLDTFGYLFLRKIVGLPGTYHNRDYTAVATTSDYSFLNKNRTIYKAMRLVRTVILPQTGSPVKINADGTLTPDVIGFFKGLAKQGLDSMMSNSELSNYAVVINPSQNVVSTGVLTITIKLQPTAEADFIVVNIGFTNIITT